MNRLQEQLLRDLEDRGLFDAAIADGFDYINAARWRRVFPTQESIEQLSQFDEAMPSGGTSAHQILHLLRQYGSPATVAQAGPRYFGFVTGGVTPIGLIAKLYGTFWDQNAAMSVMSPVVARLEEIVEGWLRSLFSLPAGTTAGFVSGTTAANICALAAARFRLLRKKNWDVNKRGLHGAPPIKIFVGEEAHASVIRAAQILGFGTDHITRLDVDSQGRIDYRTLPVLDANSILVLQAGNVNSGAFDRFDLICPKAVDAGAWIHIDGAFGLWAQCSDLRTLTKGMELATSWAVDAHKTLNTPYDSGIVFCRDREALHSAFSANAPYLNFQRQREGMNQTIEMSRRARVIELWATLKYLGLSGINEMILHMNAMAKLFGKRIGEIDGLHVVNEIAFNQVLVRCATDELTEKVLKRIVDESICWAGDSKWKGHRVIRVSISSWSTTEYDIELAVSSFQSALKQILTHA